MSKNIQSLYKDFLAKQIETLEYELNEFKRVHKIYEEDRGENFRSFSVWLPQDLVGKLKGAILEQKIRSAQDMMEPLTKWLNEIEEKRGKITAIDPNTRMNGLAMKTSRKPFNERAQTVLNGFYSKIKALKEEFEEEEKR